MEPIWDITTIATIIMAHHLASLISCEPQMIIAPSPAELRLLTITADSADKAVLSEGSEAPFDVGNNGESSLEMVILSIGVLKLSSGLVGCLARPKVPGWYLKIKTHTDTIV